jgi:hypothetical protein
VPAMLFLSCRRNSEKFRSKDLSCSSRGVHFADANEKNAGAVYISVGRRCLR